MSKFKVGDRVEVIVPYYNAQVGDVGVIKEIQERHHFYRNLYEWDVKPYKKYAVEFDREDIYFHDCNGYTKDRHGHWMIAEHLKLLDDKEEIVITRDGKTVTAKLTKNGETVKTANARCHPDDEFDYGIGAKLAVERLFAHEPEYFTGDVVCVEDPKEFYFTVGKIYHVENGSMSTGHYIISKLTSIGDLNARFNNVRFIELVK